MKNLVLILTLLTSSLFGQTGINYQGAATDANGTKLVNQNISLKTSVLQGGVDGTTSYSEIHNTTTDQFGLFNVVIGQGVSVSGDFETISWGSDDHFLKVELDATGGTNYNLVSTTQMMSVPYALYAKNAGLDSAAVANMLASMNISANNGGCDLKFPDGLMGEPITHNLSTSLDGSYTVEAGKNLYITNLYTNQYYKIKIDGITITEALFNKNVNNHLFGNTLANPFILKENQTISIDGGFGAFNGFLVTPKVEPITHYLNASEENSYTVETGKNLYITNLHTEQFYKINIDDITITEALFNMTAGDNLFGNTLSLPLIVKPGQTISLSGGYGSFNGYLVDEDFFADCGGGGGSSTSTPSSVDSAMVADMIAANTSSGLGGDWELLYDELNTNNDEPYGTVNRYGIAQSDGFLYLVGSYATVYTGNDHDTITNTWPENPILQNISANDPNEAHIIPLKKNMSWHIEFHSTLGYITKGYFIPNGGGSSSLANGGMSGTSKSFKYPDGMHGTPITIAVGTDNSYTVPEGKNLYANYFRPSSGGSLYVDGVRVATSYNNLTNQNGSELLYVGEGQTITCDNNININEMSTLNGFLTDKSVDMVSFGIGDDLNNYTVPTGKNLYVNYFRPSSGGGSLYIDGIRVATSYNNLTNQKGSELLYVGEGQTITCENVTDVNEMSTLNGYLADLDYFESPSSSSASNSGDGGNTMDLSVSTFGDTLTIGNQSVIIPGISYENFPDSLIGSITDINLNTYQTVKLGNQEWMTQNLRVTNFSNGNALNNNSGSNNSCAFEPGYKENLSGDDFLFYNALAVHDERNICPQGWRVPTVSDYQILLNFLGFNDNIESNHFHNAGIALKSNEYNVWQYSSATNQSLLNFKPDGIIYCGTNGMYHENEHRSWTSTSHGSNSTWYMNLREDENGSIQSNNQLKFGSSTNDYNYPCRCIKD